MKLEIEISDDSLKQCAIDSHKYGLEANEFVLDWIEVAFRPKYPDGTESYWIHVWVDPKEPSQHYRLHKIEGDGYDT